MARGSGYYVTFVARSCPSYDDVFANKARNDIQESLVDLGPDSPYNESGGLVDPTVEESAPQDACSPLPNWTFTLGRGIESHADSGPWGDLSKVTDPFGGARIVTKAATPLYDQYHNRIKGQQIAGATTIQLTDDERQAASVSDQLWAQGGVPGDPVLAQQYPGPQYGFAALRCAADALNGDNVETIFFPAGVSHVFCYALYVVPPPTSGTITIQKRVVGAPAGENPAFAFSGSISFDPNGFTLANGQSEDFYRAGGQDWQVSEGAVDNYTLSSVDCTAQTASRGTGSSTAMVSGAIATIHLVANEHVTCVYTNTYQPPIGGLTIAKITRGGIGRFTYTVTPSAGGAGRHETATTRRPGVPVTATPALTHLSPGAYTIREHVSTSTAGRWTTVRVTCNGAERRPGRSVHITIHSGATAACTFVNAFLPSGSISLAKVTHGSVGAVAFLIAARRAPARQYRQHAVTRHQDAAANAIPNGPANATDHLLLGRYLIAEQAPPIANPNNWTLLYVQCNGQLVPFNRGVIAVTLTPAHPRVHCIYNDRFSAHPAPPPPPPPTPPTPPSPGPPTPPSPSPSPTPSYAATDLSVTKQALDPFAVKGEPVTYRITVHNRGPDPAAHVVLADKPSGKARVVYVRPSAGRCTIGTFIVCRLGNLPANATVSIMVRLIPETSATPFVNRAVVGGATAEATLTNNVAHSTIRVIVPPAHPIACPSRVAPVAHAAC